MVRKVLYLSLKEFKSSQKRQLCDDLSNGGKGPNGKTRFQSFFHLFFTKHLITAVIAC